VATPPDGSSANWSHRPAQGRREGALAPYAVPYPQGDPHARYAPRPTEPEPYQSEQYEQYESEVVSYEPEPAPYEQPRPRIQTVDGLLKRSDEPQSAASSNHPLVRPYTMTGGRTRPRYQLAIEALVSASVQPHEVRAQLPEHQRICHLCQEIKSVAEISALLAIPLGVARILVADMAEAGLVAIHQPGGDESADGQPDVTVLERVLSGLRRL
jgi:hypothetical protein